MYNIFISYAREDYGVARRLYLDLKEAGFKPWLDKESILPGDRWERAIERAIRSSHYFLALLSSSSVSKRGYVQKELRQGLELLLEFPGDEIFLIPIRLDDCAPTHDQLNELSWLDFFPSYDTGVGKLIEAINTQRNPRETNNNDRRVGDEQISARSNHKAIYGKKKHAIYTLGKFSAGALTLIFLAAIIYPRVADLFSDGSRESSKEIVNGPLQPAPAIGESELPHTPQNQTQTSGARLDGALSMTRCNASNQCTTSGTGALCGSDEDCTSGVTRCNVLGQCTATGAGPLCSSNADCVASETDVSLSPTIKPVTSAPVTPAKFPGSGTLDVQVTLGGCSYLDFEIRSDDRITGSGRVGEEMQISAGTHMVVIKSRFGKEPAKQVVIQRGRLTTVDFTPELGKLRVNGYPKIGAPSYRLNPNSANWLASDYDQCGPAGIYEVSFGLTVLFPPDLEIRFPVEVKAGETTIVKSDSWPYQLGQVLLSQANNIGEVRIQDTNRDIQFMRPLDFSSTAYWMLTGTYKMTLLKQPYTGTEYQFEIKAGKKTILQVSGRPIPKP